MSTDRPVEPPVAEDASEAATSGLGDVLARARPKDPVGAAIARWRVAAGLFGADDGASGVGRFRLLDRLGVGGMGVIYAAFDPHLERTVAVKLVPVPEREGAGALAEAKALARLSHPNVVTIFDYGFVHEHLYIVMELVQGQTLKRWVKGCTQREILKAYRQAGEGLAAAHAALLIHRDFKPSNALMGLDGRVRVVDFGLACEAADPSAAADAAPRAGGTPRYMAPEQFTGEPVTAAADQFGFCTSLQEALGDKDGRARSVPVPRWVQAVIDRGRAKSPRDRFPSMNALLQALARDPAARRRRGIAAGALLVAGVAAFAFGRQTSKARADLCQEGPARLASAWGEGGAAAALNHVAGMSAYGRAVQPRLASELDGHARRWVAGYRDACEAGAGAIQSRALTDRRLACLERGRAALKSVADIVETTDVGGLPDLVLAVRALPDPGACGDLTALLADGEAPAAAEAPRVATLQAQLEDARVQLAAGRPKPARALAEATVAAARGVSYKPLLSEALLVEGHTMMAMEDRLGAIEPLTESYTTALQLGLSSVAVEAWARRAWTRGTSLGGADSLAGLEVIEAIAAGKATSPFARALLHNNVGCVQLALEQRAPARASFERASREAREVVGPGAIELLNVDVNLGLVTDDPARRDAVLAEAAAARARALGAEHPAALDVRWIRGLTEVRFDRALELLAPTCAALEDGGGFPAERCWGEVAFIRGETGDTAGVLAAMRRAVEVKAGYGPRSPAVPATLRWLQGDLPGATRDLAAALAALPPDAKDHTPWWDRFERAEIELALGRALRAAGRFKEAQRVLRSSLDRFVDIARKGPFTRLDRRIGRARAELAGVLVGLRGRPDTIATLAGAAAEWFRAAGGAPTEILALERLSGGGQRGQEMPSQ